MRVIGTAGHVDHGKSTLVKALTGIDPDRLKEEKEREMTIDLGFAWLTLPSGNTVSIVDVPGHEAFIKNMLAGVGGIDAAMLVIAADEGIMPQTREHLAILDLLQVKGGLVALTKSDLVDAEWIEMVTMDIRQALAETVLANTKIIPVSSKTRQGLDDLLRELDRLLQVVSPKNDFGKPRLPIDRVFSIAGFGTVVTGTLMDGSFAIGQEVEIVPSGKRGRIRGLQSHKEKLERATPGNRVAINLSGLSVDELLRGEVVALPGTIARPRCSMRGSNISPPRRNRWRITRRLIFSSARPRCLPAFVCSITNSSSRARPVGCNCISRTRLRLPRTTALSFGSRRRASRLAAASSLIRARPRAIAGSSQM